MKRLFLCKTISLLTVLLLFSTRMMGTGNGSTLPDVSLLYDDVWSALYNPVRGQCDNTPTTTGDGSHINPRIASQLRWIAISQDLLYSPYRAHLVNNPRDIRFKGKLAYGDTIWVDSPYNELNGWWVVKDSKNKRYEKSIDFLQSEGDKSLYGNDMLWSGKWENIRIYRVNNYNYMAMKMFLHRQLMDKNYLAVKTIRNKQSIYSNIGNGLKNYQQTYLGYHPMFNKTIDTTTIVNKFISENYLSKEFKQESRDKLLVLIKTKTSEILLTDM